MRGDWHPNNYINASGYSPRNPNFNFATPKRKSAQGNFKIKWLLSKQGDTIRPCFLACSFDQTHSLHVYLGAENEYEVSFLISQSFKCQTF